jgi:hypothetical protein
MNLGSIQDLYTHPGPFVSIHMDVSRNSVDAAQQMESRWTTARHELERAGVAGKVIGDIGVRLHEPSEMSGEARRTVVATDDQVVFDDVRAGHSQSPESVTLGSLPDVRGWLQQVDGQMPFVLVRADREGADIDFYRADSKPNSQHEEVHGDTLHITKVPEGDWAQKHQQTAENLWEKNARKAAEAVRSLCARHRPRVVILAGDERARNDLAKALEGAPCDVVQVEAGGRAAGSSDEALWEEVRLVLARLEAFDEEQITDRLLEKTGQGSGAARGLDDVLDALVQGKVDRLLLDLPAAEEMTVRPDEHPGLSLPSAAAKSDELPADLVLVAAGAATDTELSLLPAEQTEGAGVAALLRWDD